MAGMVLPIISSAARSPWFKATCDLTTAYGDHEGRLTPVTFDRSIADEYRVLRTRVGIFDVPERPLEFVVRAQRRSLTMCSLGPSAPWL